MKDTILILTRANDGHAEHVVDVLEHAPVRVIRFDTADFPLQVTLRTTCTPISTWQGGLHLHNHDLDLDFQDIRSIWFRRPTRFQISPGMGSEAAKFSQNEARSAIGGVLRSLPCLWVNHPEKQVSADYKPFQLHLAQVCGFQIPPTLLTNDPDEVMLFYQQCQEKMIYKPLSTSTIQVDGDTKFSAIYTTRIDETRLTEILSSVPTTACLFQRLIPKKIEIRVTVIGTSIFAAEIHSQHSPKSRIDFRQGYDDLQYAVHTLPQDMAYKCLTLVHRLGLAFAAIDLILTPDDQYVFLELNASGQFSWIEAETNLPLHQTLAELLVAGAQ
jgi:glutathione synthase/RimK-type ligase-like ATP-grasp enzyme